MLDSREEKCEQRGLPIEELNIVQLQQGDQSKSTRVGQSLIPKLRTQINKFLKANSDVFAWSHEDMLGIDPEVIVHRLNVNPGYKPVWRKMRSFNPERYEAIVEEFNKLLKARFIREVHYSTWLAM